MKLQKPLDILENSQGVEEGRARILGMFLEKKVGVGTGGVGWGLRTEGADSRGAGLGRVSWLL